MSQPLFINFKQDFISRIRSEAGPGALITPSMAQAARWISNPEVPISGIYLNPNDSTSSTFRFIESALLLRPATPIFLLDDEGDPQSGDPLKLYQTTHVRGTFQGDEPLEQMLSALNVNPDLKLIQTRATPRSEHAGYIAVPLIDFLYSRNFPFDVFVEDDQRQVRLFAVAESEIDAEYLSHLAQKTSWLLVSEESVQTVRNELKKTEATYMNADHLPLAWKTAETLFRAKQLLEEMKKGGLSDPLVEQTHHLLGDVFHLVSQLSHAARLHTFVDQARQCDRTIACATLSILMCKTLKFEKNSIVEILGLASFFQDVSLYNSPFGNLAESNPKDLSAKSMTYYLQHPSLSADLIAQHTSIPDVTLQVLRQHHERKDRTGFPNRVGGMQLHPMAEVLSLINSYLDHDPSQPIDVQIFAHYSDRVVHSFKDLLCVLGHQLAEKKSA